jgi:hypothetical protein
LDQPPGLRLRIKTAEIATAKAASIRPNTAPPGGPVAAGTGMVDSGVGEGVEVGGGIGVGEGDGGGEVAEGEVRTVVTAAGAWVASTLDTGGSVATSVGLVSVGVMVTLDMSEGVGKGSGGSVGVSAAGMVTMGVGEGGAVAGGIGVSTTSGVFVGTGVAVAAGAGVTVAVGAGVAVAAGAGVVVAAGTGVAVTVGVGASALLTTT